MREREREKYNERNFTEAEEEEKTYWNHTSNLRPRVIEPAHDMPTWRVLFLRMLAPTCDHAAQDTPSRRDFLLRMLAKKIGAQGRQGIDLFSITSLLPSITKENKIEDVDTST